MVIPFSEVFLAALVHASLQLQLGSLLLLYHASLGKYIKTKTKHLVESYISGIGMLVLLTLGAVCFAMERYFMGRLRPEEILVIVTVLVVLALIVWVFYYRRGKSTELWLPRSVARYIDQRAKNTDSNTEAFSLGLLTSIAEMPFTLMLLMVAGNGILSLRPEYQLLAVAMYTMIAILPAVILRIAVKKGQTIADIQKWRVQHKLFFRVISGAGFLVLAGFLVAFEVLV